jgi:hypothetical protein
MALSSIKANPGKKSRKIGQDTLREKGKGYGQGL